MATLTNWLDDSDLRTFSGRATYFAHASVSADELNAAERVLLDLGTTKDAVMGSGETGPT